MKPLLLALVVLLFVVRPARADEVAPSLEGPDLRARADLLLRALVVAKPDPRIRGVYAAFDPNITDASAQVACDDDGDYVVVVSDAMLRLVSFVARLAKDDKKVADYAELLASAQKPGKRLLPPEAGAYAGGVDSGNEDAWNAMMLFIYARELAALRAGDLACAHPTTTREKGDDEWTLAEREAAARTATTVYPGKYLERDEMAISDLAAIKRDETGARTLLRFLRTLEVRPRAVPHAYVTTHPYSGLRAARIEGHSRPGGPEAAAAKP